MTKEIQYKEFNGDARKQIPALLEAGYRPATMADVMDLRIDGKLKDAYVDTIDAVAYNKSGDAKIIRNSKDIGGLNHNSTLRGGALVLSNSEFESLTGKDVLPLTKKEKSKIHSKSYTQGSVKDSEVWNFLARDNSRLVKYADEIFPEMEKRFGYEKAMGLFFDGASDFNKLRAVYADGLEGRSDAGAGDSFGDGNVRFVGISVGDAKIKDLEGKISSEILSAINSGIAFKHNGILYVPTKIGKK
ncbi:hypothetical protein HOD29_05400 [archaeon]|jgi:hypothetical protein|nr:hypothetical protein [archaeon]